MLKQILIFIVFILLITGCSSIIVKPDVAIINYEHNPIIDGKITYNKSNKNYLPTLIRQNSNNNVEINYIYSVTYNNGSVDFDGINLFNPLLFVGFPMSNSDLLVSGKLSIIDSGDVLNTFESSCIAQKTRNLFSTGGNSIERKKCLLAIRDNIDNQIRNKYKKEN